MKEEIEDEKRASTAKSDLLDWLLAIDASLT